MPNTDKMIFLPQLQRYDEKIKGWADNKFLTKTDTPSLPKATATTLGGVKIGNGLNVTDDGVLSAEDDIVFTWNFDTSAFSCNKTFAEVKKIITTGVRRTATVNGLLENFSITLLVVGANDDDVMFFGTAPGDALGAGKLGSRTDGTITYLFQKGLVILYNSNGQIQMTEDLSNLNTNMSFDFKNTTFQYDQYNSFDLKDGGITSTKIADSAITAAKLASNAVTTKKIADGAITTAKIEDGSIGSTKLEPSSVTTTKIADNAIEGNHIRAGQITVNHIKDGSVTSAKLALGAVATENIQEGAITTANINDGAIKSAKLANGAVTVTKLSSGAVNEDGLADGAVTAMKIADGAVTAAKLLSRAVTTDKILDRAVSSAKLADGAVTAIKIANSTITAAKLASSVVTTDKIADGAITKAKLASSAVTTDKIADGAITKAKLASDVGAGGGAEIAFVTKEETSTNIVLKDGNSIRFITGDFYCYIINYHIKSTKNGSKIFNWKMKDADGNYILPWWMVTETNFQNISPTTSIAGNLDYRTIMGFVPRAKSAKAALATLVPVQDECEQMAAEVAKLEQDWIDNSEEIVAVDGNGVPITIATKKTELEKKQTELEKLREDYFSKLGDWKNEGQEEVRRNHG